MTAYATALPSTTSSLVGFSADLWDLVPEINPKEPADTPLPRVGPSIGPEVLTPWINAGAWDHLAAVWPALDPRQRATVAYALGGVVLPPGYSPPSTPPTDWVLAMILISRRIGAPAGFRLSGRQWTLAWTSAQDLLPAELRTGRAGSWLDRASRDKHSRLSLRSAALSTRTSVSLPFEVVWDMARPLSRDTADVVAGHPHATADALAAVGHYARLSPRARARLAVSPLYPARRVPRLYVDADSEVLDPLLAAEIPHDRLVDLLDQGFPLPTASALAGSQAASRLIATRLTASTRVLRAAFDGLDITQHPDLCRGAMHARRPEARRALAATVNDSGVLATLAEDPDGRVRSIVARRILKALTQPVDPTEGLPDDD